MWFECLELMFITLFIAMLLLLFIIIIIKTNIIRVSLSKFNTF